MKILFCFLALFFLGCAVVPDLPAEAPGGDVAIQLKNRQLTACRRICAGEDGKTAFRKINNQLYCPEAAFLHEVHCIDLFAAGEKKPAAYILPPADWDEIAHKAGLYFHSQIIEWVKDKEFLCDKGFCGANPAEGLKILEKFIYSDTGIKEALQ